MNKSGKIYDRSDLINEICGRYGQDIFTAPTASETVLLTLKALVAILPDALAEFGAVHVHDLGVFTLEHRAARKGFDFAAGEQIEIPPYQDIEFKAAPLVRAILEQRTGQEVKG
jgi:nucleoid DNA-binding protein